MSSVNVENCVKSRRFLCNNSKWNGVSAVQPLTILCNRDKMFAKRQASLLFNKWIKRIAPPRLPLRVKTRGTKEYAVMVELGSDASAAGGGSSELSAWQRSARRKPALSGEAAAGHRNR